MEKWKARFLVAFLTLLPYAVAFADVDDPEGQTAKVARTFAGVVYVVFAAILILYGAALVFLPVVMGYNAYRRSKMDQATNPVADGVKMGIAWLAGLLVLGFFAAYGLDKYGLAPKDVVGNLIGTMINRFIGAQ